VLSLQRLQRRAPAVFAEHAAGITGPRRKGTKSRKKRRKKRL
jgi:hypothetical protein